MTASVSVVLDKRDDVVTLPTSAVSTTGTSQTVIVKAETARRRHRTITIGLRGDSAVEITDGLDVGDQVVITTAASTGTSSGFPGGGGPPGGGGLGGGLGGGARWRGRTPVIGTPVIALRDLTKVYGEGDTTVHALRGRQPRHRRRRVRRDHGRVGERQEHADAHHRLSRRRHRRSLPARRPRRRDARRVRARRSCATARSASCSRASTSSRARRAFANVELPMVYANVPKAERQRRARWPRSRRSGSTTARDALPESALRRPAAARRDRAGDRHRSRDHPRRRADRRARQRVDRRGARHLRPAPRARAAPSS